MPTTYTHYRFGSDVFRQLPAALKEQIAPFREFYDLGLHGPDLLFYYKALQKNPVNQLGYVMHSKPAREFFRAAKLAMDQLSEPGSSLAYLYGFICHFALDCTCHPYIGERVRFTGITHSEIEAELDRAFMVMDGLNPITYHPAMHINASESAARTIAHFFPPVKERQIFRAIRSMRWYCDMLVAPQPWKRKLIFRLLKLGGCYDNIHGMVINYKPNPSCAVMCTTLENLYLQAVPAAVELISNYQAYLLGDQKLDARFNHTFGET